MEENYKAEEEKDMKNETGETKVVAVATSQSTTVPTKLATTLKPSIIKKPSPNIAKPSH